MAESSYSLPEVSLSQETAFPADTEPLWGEALQLALIYDLTDCLRSPCPLPPPILGSPSLGKGPEGYLAQEGRPETSADRCHPESCWTAPEEAPRRDQLQLYFEQSFPTLCQYKSIGQSGKARTRWPALTDKGAGPDPGSGLLH